MSYSTTRCPKRPRQQKECLVWLEDVCRDEREKRLRAVSKDVLIQLVADYEERFKAADEKTRKWQSIAADAYKAMKVMDRLFKEYMAEQQNQPAPMKPCKPPRRSVKDWWIDTLNGLRGS